MPTNTPAPTAFPPTATFAEAYARLSAIANRLKGPGSATSIDSLFQDVRDAKEAYGLCKARLQVIRTEVEGLEDAEDV